jgi:hypothetical protein
MKSYRKEVWKYLGEFVREEFEEKAKRGEIALCYTSIRRHFKPESIAKLRIVEFRRTMTKTIEDVVFFLWDDRPDTNLQRGQWDNAPFRVLARRAIEIIGLHCGSDVGDIFRDNIKRYFIATHWLFPQPTQTKFIQRGKDHSVQCFAVHHRRLAFFERF